MFQKLTTILLLTAIAVQAIFGGLNDSVAICLGGGHEHEATEVVVHCEFECSHHSEWPTPIVEGEDVGDCSCTDVELSLITLLTIPKDNDVVNLLEFALLPTIPSRPFLSLDEASWHASFEFPPVRQEHLLVLRSTRLQV